jgi:hypothetical protein
MWGVTQQQLMRDEFRAGWLPAICYDDSLISTPTSSNISEKLVSQNVGYNVQNENMNEYTRGSPSSDELSPGITRSTPPSAGQSTFHQGMSHIKKQRTDLIIKA